MNWIKHLEEQKSKGKIRGYNTPRESESKPIIPKGAINRSEAKGWLEFNLQYWCNDRALTLEKEFLFHEQRKWRFDFAITGLKIAIEYEGIYSEKSRHTTVGGFTGDVEKYNAATLVGWRVIRVTAKDYKNVLQILKNMK